MKNKKHPKQAQQKPKPPTSTTPNTPEGWQTKSLDEILSPEQLDAVLEIIGKYAGQQVSECFPELKGYLITQRAELEAKGILPEFLSYAILSSLMSHQPSGCGDDCTHHHPESSHSE
jgi:hypothetical protein